MTTKEFIEEKEENQETWENIEVELYKDILNEILEDLSYKIFEVSVNDEKIEKN